MKGRVSADQVIRWAVLVSLDKSFIVSWIVRWPILCRWALDGPGMVLDSALCAVLSGCGFWLILSKRRRVVPLLAVG